MRVLVWIVEETWQATVAAAAAFLPADADITLLHVRSDAETVARGARDALLGRSRRTSGEALDAISEQGARDLLADAQAALGRQAVLGARSGRIEYEVVAAAATADLRARPRRGSPASRAAEPWTHRALRRRPRPLRGAPRLARHALPMSSRHETTPASPRRKEKVMNQQLICELNLALIPETELASRHSTFSRPHWLPMRVKIVCASSRRVCTECSSPRRHPTDASSVKI